MTQENRFLFHFDETACRRCAARCCRGQSGNIWVTLHEIQKIITHLGMNPIDAMDALFERRQGRITIKERHIDPAGKEEDGEIGEFHCIFLDDSCRCRIYPVRPSQCRSFPFWEHYRSRDKLQALLHDCPGVSILSGK